MVDADERSLERLQRVPAVSDIHSTNKLAGNGYVSSQSTNISPDKSKSTIKLSPPDLNYRPPAGHWLDSPIELESAEQIGGLPEQGDVVQIGKDYTGISRNGPFFSVLKPTPPSKTRVRRSSDRSPCGDVRDKVACFNRVLLAVATYKAKDRSSVKHFIGRQIKNQRYPPPSSWAEVNPPNDGTDIGQWKRSYKRGLDLMSRDLRSNGILSFCSPGMPIEVCIKWLRMRYDKVWRGRFWRNNRGLVGVDISIINKTVVTPSYFYNGNRIPVRRYLYIDTPPCSLKY